MQILAVPMSVEPCDPFAFFPLAPALEPVGMSVDAFAVLLAIVPEPFVLAPVLPRISALPMFPIV